MLPMVAGWDPNRPPGGLDRRSAGMGPVAPDKGIAYPLLSLAISTACAAYVAPVLHTVRALAMVRARSMRDINSLVDCLPVARKARHGGRRGMLQPHHHIYNALF